MGAWGVRPPSDLPDENGSQYADDGHSTCDHGHANGSVLGDLIINIPFERPCLLVVRLISQQPVYGLHGVTILMNLMVREGEVVQIDPGGRRVINQQS